MGKFVIFPALLTWTWTLCVLDSSIFCRILSLRYSSYAKGFAMVFTWSRVKCYNCDIWPFGNIRMPHDLRNGSNKYFRVKQPDTVADIPPCDTALCPWKSRACRLSGETTQSGETNLEKKHQNWIHTKEIHSWFLKRWIRLILSLIFWGPNYDPIWTTSTHLSC